MSIEITITSLVSNYYTKLNGVTVDIFKIFAFNPNYASTVKPFTTGQNVTINNIVYDLSQVLLYYSTYLSTPPFVTGNNTKINNITYDISQIFIFYPIAFTSTNIGIVYYNSNLNYSLVFKNNTINNVDTKTSATDVLYSFNFYLYTNINGYLIAGGGGGSPGSTNSSDSKGGAGGGGGGVTQITQGVDRSIPINITVGAGGLGAKVAPDDGLDGRDSIITINNITTATAGKGYGAIGAFSENHVNPYIPTTNGGSYPGQTIGIGGCSGNGEDFSNTPQGGGGGGVGVNTSTFTSFSITNGNYNTFITTQNGGSNYGGSGGTGKGVKPTNGSFGAGGGGGAGVNSSYSAQSGASGGNGYVMLILTF